MKVAYVFGAAALVAIGVALLWLAFTPMPALNTFDTRKISQSTQIYDREGRTLLFDLNSNMKREVVPLSEISPNLQKATIAIEDSRFYAHGGVDLQGIARAIVVDIYHMAFVQGGSTLTQQVIKNTMLTGEKNILRKLQEMVLAIRLEQRYSKDEILEFYFNVTPYGGTLYGAEVAAQQFFNKSAKDLTLAEAAYMAAIPQRPTYFSPYGNNRDALNERQEIVLARMLELDLITKEEHNAAVAEQVAFSRQRDNSILAPHFVFYIEQQLEERFGPDVSTQGLTVITTLDAELQRESQDIVKEYAIRNDAQFDAENAAMVGIDPKTGQILAMVGSRDYFDESVDGNFNIAVARRQPGSAFKPFVYAAAIQKGFTTETAILDLPTQFSTSCSVADVFNSTLPCYAPGNYDDTFRGPMTFRAALAQSINVPAVKALYLAGIPNTLTLAKNLGLTTLGQPREYGLSLALGAAEVRLLDLTGAYAAFANDGEYHPPVGILEIRDSRGKVVEKFEENPRQAVDAEIARQISSMLSDDQARSTPGNNPFNFPGYDVAAKTGTTNESRDVWTVGYTPSVAIGVWAGNNDNRPMQRQTAGMIVAPMWNQIMRFALGKYPQEFFAAPPGIPDSLHPALRGSAYGTTGSLNDILYWVDKDNPRGGGNSWGDSQFPYWQYSINGLWMNASSTATSTATTTDSGNTDEDRDENSDRSSRSNRENNGNGRNESNQQPILPIRVPIAPVL